jgi:hypothetical protein
MASIAGNTYGTACLADIVLSPIRIAPSIEMPPDLPAPTSRNTVFQVKTRGGPIVTEMAGGLLGQVTGAGRSLAPRDDYFGWPARPSTLGDVS